MKHFEVKMLLPYWFGWVLRIHPNWNWTKCFHQRRFSRKTSERIEVPPSHPPLKHLHPLNQIFEPLSGRKIRYIKKFTSNSFDEYVYAIIIRTGGQRRRAYTSSPLRKDRCNLGIEIGTLELFSEEPPLPFPFSICFRWICIRNWLKRGLLYTYAWVLLSL